MEDLGIHGEDNLKWVFKGTGYWGELSSSSSEYGPVACC